MDVPPLPETEAELASWSVYADWLLAAGDPRGELIARDLALPASPDPAQLAMFHELAKKLLRERQKTPQTWRLGHVWSLVITGGYRYHGPTDAGTVASAIDYLWKPEARRLVTLDTNAADWADRATWIKICAALPPSCRRLSLYGQRYPNLHAIVAAMPPMIREIGLAWTMDADAAFDDRFERVEIFGAVGITALERIAIAFATTTTPMLRFRDVVGGPFRWDRVTFADAGDAALVRPGRAIVIGGRRLLEQQRRHGPINVRAQLARTVPEVATNGFMRHHDRWTLAGDEEFRVSHNGEPVPTGAIAVVSHGDRVTIQGTDFDFVAGDLTVVDAACRAAVAG